MIFINIDSNRPNDNVLGIIYILEKAGYNFKLFSNNAHSPTSLFHHYFSRSYPIHKKIDSRMIVFKNPRILVFGGDLRITKLKFLNSIINNLFVSTLFVTPGIVDKPIGKQKFDDQLRNRIFYRLRRLLIALVRRYYLLSTNSDYSIYYQSMNYLPAHRCLQLPLPKHIWMQLMIESSTNKCQKHTLFAPTHDTSQERNKILDVMIAHPANYSRYRISIHPQDAEKYAVPMELRFDGNWNAISCVVTDRSSLGFDFTHACDGEHYRLNTNKGMAQDNPKSVFGLEVKWVNELADVPTIHKQPTSEGLSNDMQAWHTFLKKIY